MKNLTFNFARESKHNPYIIICTDVLPENGNCNMLSALDGENFFPFQGLANFFVTDNGGCRKVLSEFCRSFSIECGGKILQLNFNRHKALYYFNNENKPVCLGVSFTKAEYLLQESGMIAIRAVQESTDEDVSQEDKWMFYHPESDSISGI